MRSMWALGTIFNGQSRALARSCPEAKLLSIVIEQKGMETFSASPEEPRACSLYWEPRFSFLE